MTRVGELKGRVRTESGSDRVFIIDKGYARRRADPVATAPGTDFTAGAGPCQFRHYTLKRFCERGLRVDYVKHRDGYSSRFDRRQLRAQVFGKTKQDRGDLTLFRFTERL